MEIYQKKFSNKVRYRFDDEGVDYRVEDGSGSRSFRVAYAQIGSDRQSLEERNQWLRNVGLLWMALGAVFTGMSLTGESGLKVSFWLWIGLACFAVYQFRSTRFTIIPTERGNLLVIDGENGQRILDEIDSRRAAYLKREFDFMPEGESPDQHRSRFKWLHRERALSDDELQQRLATVDALEREICVDMKPSPGARIN